MLEDDLVDLEYFGKVDIGSAATLEALRFTFESNEIWSGYSNFGMPKISGVSRKSWSA